MPQTVTNKIFIAVIVIITLCNDLLGQKLTPTETKAVLEISVTNFKGGALPNEKIILTGEKNKTKINVTTNNEGKASVLLPEGDTYNIDYRNFTEQVNYSKIKIPTELGAFTYQLNIKFEPDKVFTLKNVNFETAKATLTNSSYTALNELVEALKAKLSMEIEIAGHTDNIGTDETNLKLSQDRANSVVNYLTSKGISKKRLTAKGYGATQPIADNETEEGRKQNRRTEVRIIVQ